MRVNNSLSRCLTMAAAVVGIAVTSRPAVAAGMYGGMKDSEVPRFLIPRMSHPPVLDGKIETQEWQEALAISGAAAQGTNELHPRPTTFYLAWDNDNLYLACRSWVMPDHKPRVGGRGPNQAQTGDAGLELVLTPRGKNVPEGRPEIGYKFNVNCLGYDGNLQKTTLGQMMMNWLPVFKNAVSLGSPGSGPRGGRWWQIEMVMPAREFELSGPNRVGDAWGVMLGMNGMSADFSFDRIPCNSGYFIPTGHCVGVLAEKVPAMQMLMDEFPGPCEGMAQTLFRVYNPTAEPVTVMIAARYSALRKTDNKEEVVEELLRDEPALTAAPGQTAEYRLAQKLPKELGTDRGAIRYRVTLKDTELLRYAAYFRTNSAAALLKTPPRTTAFPITGSFDPLGSTLLVGCDSYYLDQPESAAAFTYQLTADKDGRVVTQGVLTKAVNYQFSELLRLPVLQPGTYTLQATLRTADGKAGATEKCVIEKKDEAKEFAAWWNNDLGSTKRVIWPFTAMKRQKNRVSMWGRDYDLDGLGLPRSITANGGELTAAAARIVVTVAGKEQVIRLASGPTFTATKDWRVSFTGTATGAGLRFNSQGWVEQDGLCYVELSYQPDGKQPVTIDALRLEYPLNAKDAQCLYSVGAGNNFAPRTTKTLANKEGLLWSTLETGRAGSHMLVGSFYPTVWVGNHRRGLMWWGDNDQGWIPDNAVPAHSVVRKGTEVVLVNHIVGTQVSLADKRTIAFGYMATPFRPLPKGWRASITSEDGGFKGPHKGRVDPKTKQMIDTWCVLHPPSYDPEEWAGLWAEYKPKADEFVTRTQVFNPHRARSSAGSYPHTSIPIIGYPVSYTKEPGAYLAAAWQGGRYRNFSKSHSDYLLYLISRSVKEGGIRSFYWDLVSPSCAESEQAGLGYRLPDGRMQPGYFGFNFRRFSMRLYALCNDLGLSPGGVGVHSTNSFFLVANPWIDAVLDGEEHQVMDSSPFDWVDGFSVARMRALACPHNFGNVISWMHIMQVGGQRGFELQSQQVEYMRLFDAWARTFTPEIVPTSLLEWGINDERVEYTPFWENATATTGDKEILVSMWRLPDRVMLGVFNNNRKEKKNAVIHIDLDTLDLVPALPWQEFIRVTALDKGPSYFQDYWGERNLKLYMKADPLVDETWRTEPQLDFPARTLKIDGIAPHRGRFISVRRY